MSRIATQHEQQGAHNVAGGMALTNALGRYAPQQHLVMMQWSEYDHCSVTALDGLTAVPPPVKLKIRVRRGGG